MALTDMGKRAAMKGGLFSSTRYIALLSSSTTELSGHGYSRAALTAAQASVANNGNITGPANHPIYTADDDSAEQATHVAIYDAATGGNQLVTPGAITSPPAAPVNGQQFRLSLTVTA